jgi:hypothetical protein
MSPRVGGGSGVVPAHVLAHGPNTDAVVGSVVFMLERQITYVMGCLRVQPHGGR